MVVVKQNRSKLLIHASWIVVIDGRGRTDEYLFIMTTKHQSTINNRSIIQNTVSAASEEYSRKVNQKRRANGGTIQQELGGTESYLQYMMYDGIRSILNNKQEFSCFCDGTLEKDANGGAVHEAWNIRNLLEPCTAYYLLTMLPWSWGSSMHYTSFHVSCLKQSVMGFNRLRRRPQSHSPNVTYITQPNKTTDAGTGYDLCSPPIPISSSGKHSRYYPFDVGTKPSKTTTTV